MKIHKIYLNVITSFFGIYFSKRSIIILLGTKEVPSPSRKRFMPTKFPSQSKSGPPSQAYNK
jgi:hypothetical protein